MSRRVVITGLGPITAFGVGIGPLWDAMVQGRSAVRRIKRFDPGGYECQVAAELDAAAFDVKAVVPKSYRKATKVMCRDVELAVGGARAAVEDAGLNTKGMEVKEGGGTPPIPPDRLGCHIGAGLICAEVDELTAAIWTSRGEGGEVDLKHWGREGMNNLTPLWLLKYLPNMLACHVTIIHDCRGPSNTITCCEASSGLSIGESMRVIHRGSADACLSGGAESKVNPMAMMRQAFAGRLSPAAHDCEPGSVLRPFDPQASGTVLGEGGGIVVVEAADVAQRRAKAAYAEITGFACTQSFCADTVGLEAEPEGIADAIELALGQAGTGPEAIDAIVPLGSSIPGVDRAEAAAIERVFGERARRIPLVTTIPNTGNCNAGAGAVAVSVAAMSLREQTLPARLNTASSNGLDAAACPARPAALRNVLVFQTSQGGQNVALVLKKA